MLNLKAKCFLFKFYSVNCFFETQVEIKELFVDYKNKCFENIGFKIKSDEYSPWVFSTKYNPKVTSHKIFNGFYTDCFEPQSEISQFKIKCHVKRLNLPKDTDNGFKFNEIFETELIVDYAELNVCNEICTNVSVSEEYQIQLECKILSILPWKPRGQVKIDTIPKYSLENRSRPYFVGHRGLGRDTEQPFMENTIDSFNKCAEYGMDFVEFDVHFTKDNKAIVFHDFLLVQENESDRRNTIRGMTYDQINTQIESKRKFGIFPTLNQVMKKVSRNIGFLIELKFPQLKYDGTMEHQSPSSLFKSNNEYMDKNQYVDKILNIIIEKIAKKPRNIVLLSFDADISLMIKLKQNLFPTFIITRGLPLDEIPINHMDNRMNTFGGAMKWARFCDLDGVVSRFHESLKPEYLLCKNLGLQIFVYGDIPISEEFLDGSKNLGLDGLILDDVVELYNKRLLK